MDSHPHSGVPDRRTFLTTVAAGLAGVPGRVTATGRLSKSEDVPAGLIVRSRRPLDVETPVAIFREYLTPNRWFFIRSHLGVPLVAPEVFPWSITVEGEVQSPREWSLEALDRLPPTTVTAVLQCAGNGRSYFEPRVAGLGWERGAVGNAEWSGPRLIDVLRECRVRESAAHLHFLGADLPPHPKTPPYLRSLPLARALHPETILALRMNGEPLPIPQGGPVRLVVPGWAGNHWLKWVRRIVAASEPAAGFYQQTAYRIPKRPVPPGVEVAPEQLDYVTELNVKSLITRPCEDAVLGSGRQEIQGVAWTGTGRVVKVEVALVESGREHWRPAELYGPDRPYAWRLWRLDWEPTYPGTYTIRSRATDSRGATQPESTPWNRSGYLWNAIDTVRCEVRPA